MTPERWQAVKAVVGRVMDLPSAEREAELAVLDRSDPDAACEARRLLSHHSAARTDGFMETPAAVAVMRPEPADGVGLRIGQYRTTGVLGEGGMGVVYRAEQEHPRRDVALKVIRPGIATAAMLRRFELEAEMLGRLQHPGIAQIFEAGTAGGQPYFAMELVEGEPLTDYVHRRGMALRERIRLFVRVCEAVQHAHVKGVIHRDLKPGNVIITADGQPKVLDFGVARLSDAADRATIQTGAGQIIGTIPYMSPEQIAPPAGEADSVDTRSDVYSLGVMLYELLTGELPYNVERKSIVEAARIIRQDAPRPLGATHRWLRGDLQTIVGTALEKDKQRRYQSAAELGADLNRYLSNQAIVARPQGPWYRAEKFVLRHKLGVGATAALIVLLGTSTVVVMGQRDVARREAAKATGVDELLREMLATIDPTRARGKEMTVREMLDDAAKRLESSHPAEPEVAALVHETIGNTYWRIGELIAAERHLRRAVEIGTPLMGEDHPRLLSAMNTMAMVYKDVGRMQDSGVLVERVYKVRLRKLGEEHPETLSSMNNMARWLGTQKRHEEGLALMRRVVDVRTRLLGSGDRGTLASRDNVGRMLMDAGQLPESEAQIRAVLADFEREFGADDPDTLVAVQNLANVLWKQGRLEEAEREARRLIAGRERVLGESHIMTAGGRILLCRILIAMNRHQEAEPLARSSVPISEAIPGSAVTVSWRELHADCLAGSGRPGDAVTVYAALYEAMAADKPSPSNGGKRLARKLANTCRQMGADADAARWEQIAAVEAD